MTDKATSRLSTKASSANTGHLFSEVGMIVQQKLCWLLPQDADALLAVVWHAFLGTKYVYVACYEQDLTRLKGAIGRFCGLYPLF